MSDTKAGSNKRAGKPVIVFYDRNAVAMLDLELSLRELLGEAAQLSPLARLTDLSHLAADGDVVLFLLDGKLNASSYAPLDPADPRIVYLIDRPDSGKPQIEKRPSRFSLSRVPAIARLLAPP
jgi:hypothetical protein